VHHASSLVLTAALVACVSSAQHQQRSEANAPSQSPNCLAAIDQAIECEARIPVWAYDPKTNTCYEYFYGGCPDPRPVIINRFASQPECVRQCIITK
jgi:hypothetical protein